MSDQKTRKPEVNLDYLDQPIKSDTWKNLTFTKDGRTYLSPNINNSEEEAKAVSDKYDKLTNEKYPTGNVWIVKSGGETLYLWSNYSHTIQIPWKG